MTPSEKGALVRSAYGRGYHDAVRKAQEESMAISESRFNELAKNLNSAQQAVLASVPLNDEWSAHQVQADMKATGRTKSLSDVLGILNSLVAAGLVAEKERGKFGRVPLREKISTIRSVDTERETPPASDAVAKATAQQDGLTQLAALAAEVKMIASRMAGVAKQIEDAALAAEERAQDANAQAEKYKQLRALLKGLD